jgi:hypothetical protein
MDIFVNEYINWVNLSTFVAGSTKSIKTFRGNDGKQKQAY